MAFCKFCGKEIPDGSVCDCPEAQAAAAASTSSDASSVETSSAAETSSPEPSSPYPTEEASVKPSGSKTGAAVLIAGLVIVLLIIIGIISAIAGGGYKKPVKNFAKALNKGDGKLLAETMLTDEILDEVDDDDFDDLSDTLESIIDFAEDEYGKNIKFSISIEDKEKLSKSEIKDIEEEYEDNFDAKVEITKGYELDTELTIKGKDGKDEDDLTITVVKIKGEGWKLSPDSMFGIY